MSASMMPTCNPDWAMATARLTVTDDLPTPPLPDAIAKSFVRESGRLNGMSRLTLPSRSDVCSAERWASSMTPKATETPVTPGRALTAAVTSEVSRSRIGQPTTVSRSRTSTWPASEIRIPSTMPSSVIGLWISGSFTFARAARTCSTPGDVMAPPYVATGSALGVVGLSRLLGSRVGTVVEPFLGPLVLVLELLEQRPQLGADEVAGRHLAQRHPHARHLPRQELHVRVRAGVGHPVPLADDPVPVLLPVLGEEDQRRGVRGLEAQHQREEDEREGVEPARRQPVVEHPDDDEAGHVEQEPGGPHEPRELLGEAAEGVVLEPGAPDHPPLLARDVETLGVATSVAPGMAAVAELPGVLAVPAVGA